MRLFSKQLFKQITLTVLGVLLAQFAFAAGACLLPEADTAYDHHQSFDEDDAHAVVTACETAEQSLLSQTRDTKSVTAILQPAVVIDVLYPQQRLANHASLSYPGIPPALSVLFCSFQI